MSPQRNRSLIAWLTVTVVVAGLLIGGGLWVGNFFKDAFAPRLSTGCTATVGDATYRLALDQSQNAALISALAVKRGMPARAASIALATALQESKLRNIDYGDLDSVGLFQQRPSQDWGTVAQIMDPVYSTNAFYDVLAKVPGYADMSINDAAQIVQRSGYPHAYAQHEPLSRAFASALTGQTPAALSCTLLPATAVSTPAAVSAELQTAFGPVRTNSPNSAVLTVDASAQLGWAVAQWAVANAQQFGLTQVSYDGKIWDRNSNEGSNNVGWQADPQARPDGIVTLELATLH